MMISKLLRLYKRSHGLRQICNIVVYIAHSACTIHLLNLPEKNAKRDIIHGVKHLEEMAEGWLCARRTLGILSVLSKRWKVEMPDDAAAVLTRTDAKFGPWTDVSTPRPAKREPQLIEDSPQAYQPSPPHQPYSMSLANTATQFFDRSSRPLASLSSQAEALHRTSETHSLPPNDASTLAHPRVQHQHSDLSTSSVAGNPATPASTHARRSIDGTSSSGNSPSQLFGGVEQLVREGQDWWLRDQNQLAIEFNAWHYGTDDIASWFASQGTVGSPASVSYATSPVVTAGADATVNGGAVGGGQQVNGTAGPNGAINGYGNSLSGYNESEWYQ